MKQLAMNLRCENGRKCPRSVRRRIRRAAAVALAEEDVKDKCVLSVLITDDAGIRTINRDSRGVDQATDVLSFPMGDEDPRSGRVLLGDMVLNLERAQAQGQEFGHGAEREISYLTVHSVLHLLGYDHVDEGPQKKEMRTREKRIMHALGLGPENLKTEP